MSRRQHAKVPLGDISKYPNARPLFTRPLPWWATKVGSAGLLVCTMAFAGSAVHTTWNYWTEPIQVTTPPEAPGGEEKKVMQWDLRPTWQRAGLCLAHTVAACMFAGGLLAKKALYTRSVWLVSPYIPAQANAKQASVDLRRIIVQSAGSKGTSGYEFPAQSSWLEEAETRDEVVLRISDANLQSRFSLPLKGAAVAGQEYQNIEEARGKIIAEWRALQPHAPRKS